MASAAEQLAANMNFGAFQKATELHQRIWFTLGALVIYRLGTYIPIPGIDPATFAAAFEARPGHPWHVQHVLGRRRAAHGDLRPERDALHLGLDHRAAPRLGYPPWEKLKKEGGEAGRKQLNQYTRYLTVVLAIFQSAGIAFGLQNAPAHRRQPRPSSSCRRWRR